MYYRDRTIRLFWRKVHKTDECWLWTGAVGEKGYGFFGVDGRLMRAHRFSYSLHHGTIDENLQVLHECDTPACVNPAHLRQGTNADNIQDAYMKGRLRLPTYAGKLTDAQREEIRREWSGAFVIPRSAAVRYGITQAYMRRVARKKSRTL